MTTVHQDFYNLLMQSISEEDTNEIISDEERCLITDEPLEENHITLSCKHSFNYDALFSEVVKQKTCYNSNEIQRLKTRQIKCPYCRNIENNILPYINSKPKIYGVNTPLKYGLKPYKCKYIFKSGKRKGLTCNRPSINKLCTQHLKYKEKIEKLHNSISKCNSIIKSGKRKGETCGKKAKTNGKCGFHCKK